MKTIRDPSQGRLFDPFDGVIGKTGRRQMEQGWQSLFRESILGLMPVHRISGSFSDDSGRRSAELHAMIGLILIRELKGWTVPEAHEAVLYRVDIQYALNLEPGFDISQRTIERYLAQVQDDPKISEEIFTEVTDMLLRSLEVKVQKQRLDSTHVLSDMSRVGRARMIGLALKRFFAELKKKHPAALEVLDGELLERYCTKSDAQVFAHRLSTTEQRRVALQQAAEDLYAVLTAFQDHSPIHESQKYLQLQTIFSQQCTVHEEFVEVVKKTGGNVIVNTSDPDAGFCRYKGAGYSAQIAETFNEDGDENFITAVSVTEASKSDAHAVPEVLDELKSRGHLPEELLADTAYGSNENVELARSENVELVAPAGRNRQHAPDELDYDDFELNAELEVVSCPAGHAPTSTSYSTGSGRTWAKMNASVCQGCPLLPRCPVGRDKATEQPNGRVQFRISSIAGAKRRKREATPEFKDRYRWRAGIEGTNSGLKRRMKMGRLPVRGLKAVTMAILLKVTGWNLFRGVSLRNARRKQLEPAIV